jgi:hypothetical protein
MSIVRPPMHFATGDEIDASDLLLEDCGLRCAKPCIREITRCESSVDRAPRTIAARYVRVIVQFWLRVSFLPLTL